MASGKHRENHASATRGRDFVRRWNDAIVGGVLGFFATVILLAWCVRCVEFIQFDSSLPPPLFVDAVGLLTLSVGFFAVSRGRLRAAGNAGTTVVVIGLATLVDRTPSLSFGLDRWLTETGPGLKPFTTASPWIVSLGMILAGTILFLKARPRMRPWQELASALIGVTLGPILVALLLMPLLVGKRAPVSAAPPLMILGMVIVGLATTGVMWRRCVPNLRIHRTLPAIVVLLGFALTLMTHDRLSADRRERITRQVQIETSLIRQRIEERLSKEAAEVSEIAGNWRSSTPEDRLDTIGRHLGQERSCLNIGRVGPDLSLRWTESSQWRALPKTLAETGLGERLTEAARAGQLLLAKPPRSAWNDGGLSEGGSHMLLLYSPSLANDPEAGGLLSVYQIPQLFESILHTNIAAAYATEVTDHTGVVFSRHATRAGDRDLWKNTLPVHFRDFDCQVTVWPTHEALARDNLSLPEMALGIGLLLTLLLALAVYLAQTARRRAREVEAALHERESAQLALIQSEGKYRTLIENLGQGVFLQDSNHRYIAANAEFCRRVGWNGSDVINRTESDLFEPQHAARHGLEVQTVLREGRQLESEEERVEGNRKVIVRQVLTPVRDAEGKTVSVLGICFDVTEQRQLEAHVLQASKMDAIGQLAGGIAHDFNNLLTAILGNLQLLAASLPEADECQTFTAEALTATERAASLTRRLLGFSRNHHQLNWSPVDLPSMVNEVVGLLRRTIDPLVKIKTRLADDLPEVSGDPGQLHQVLMNLCLNARDAIPESGQILIEAEAVCIEALPVGGSPQARPGKFVRLRVSDTGSGMTEEVMARIYEPFFTTKEVGKGTGLGLAMVFAIVRQHDGWIECLSEEGQGTRFDIYIPCAESRTKSEPVREAPLPAWKVGKRSSSWTTRTSSVAWPPPSCGARATRCLRHPTARKRLIFMPWREAGLIW